METRWLAHFLARKECEVNDCIVLFGWKTLIPPELNSVFLQDRSCMIFFAVFNENLITFFPKNNQRRRKRLVDSYVHLRSTY